MSSLGLSFHPLFSLLEIILALLSAFSFFIYKEWNRKQKYLPLRLIALGLVLISFLGLVLQPSYKNREVNGTLLLTKDFDRTKADSLVRLYPQLKIIRTKDADSYINSDILPSWNELTEENLQFVIGEGLPSDALELMGEKEFRFFPCTLPFGVINLTFPNQIIANRKNDISGTYNGLSKTKLKLIGPGGIEDSVVLPKGKNTFRFTYKPKQSGLFIYTLTIEDSLGKMYNEPLPLSIQAEEKLRILFLQKFPGAEVRFLKNYLSEKGHALTLRYQTSKNNFAYEYANTNAARIDFLNSELLKSFDLVMLDEKSWVELRAIERDLLQKSIREGLGLIFIDSDLTAKTFGQFIPVEINAAFADTAHVKLDGVREFALPAAPSQLKTQITVMPIIKNKNRILSGYAYYGSGKIGFQWLEETYRLYLQGDDNAYAFIWASLIERVAREMKGSKIELINPFPYYENESLNVALIPSESTPTLFSDSISVALMEDVIIDNYWAGKTWAGRVGWHVLRTRDSGQLNYFVCNSEAWQSLRVTHQIHQNLIAQNSGSPIQSSSDVQTDVSKLLFYLLFLISMGFLWLVPKI